MGAPTIWTSTNTTKTKFLDGTFSSGSSYKCALFLSTSNISVTSTTYAGVTNEVANGLGYTTGGIAVTNSLSGTTTVTDTWTVNPVWTAAGGTITARFAVIYKVGGDVVFFCTLDSAPADVSATDTNTLTVAASGSGIFTLA